MVYYSGTGDIRTPDPTPLITPPYQFQKEDEMGKAEDIRSTIKFLWGITEIGEADDLY